MIFTRRFGALAARPRFPDAPELQQEPGTPIDLDAELTQLTADTQPGQRGDKADESAA
ncbi:hypothetical protein PWY87_24015 [Kribbella solani]|uniref:hypothetical protein n=1 Tax=Kribbella solani TaxID=236067 RepID=UPI0029AA5F41|nr:hypothetical protein [Kribbella solani]MDX2968966.1 hypothetical protein [Kribbella solani]MDX3004773.1 hypothetical protein [Kribbella solani]